MSILQKCYESARGGKEYMRVTREEKLEFRPLMALSLLANENVNKVLTGVMRSSDASLTGGATLYCPFERFHELQRSVVSNAYNALKQDINVQDVASKLISKWRWEYEKHINVLDSQAVVLGILRALRHKARTGRGATDLTDSKVLYYMLF